jgi:hypothetical protein
VYSVKLTSELSDLAATHRPALCVGGRRMNIVEINCLLFQETVSYIELMKGLDAGRD